MNLKESRDLAPVPGNPGATLRTVPEWVCPECDYFEEVEAKGT
jgi:acetone carboxylase gamma subunit